MDYSSGSISENREISSSALHERAHRLPLLRKEGSTAIGSATTPEFRPRRPTNQIQLPENSTTNHGLRPVQARIDIADRKMSPKTKAPNLPSLHSSPSITQGTFTTIKAPTKPRKLVDVRQAHVRPVTHTNSMTWKRPFANRGERGRVGQEQERERWSKVHANLKKLELDLRAKPIVPKDFEDWVAHRAGRLQDEQKDKRRKIHNMKAAAQAGYSGFLPGYRPPKIGPAFGRRLFTSVNNLGAVLSWPTIWCPWFRSTQDRPEAPWPCSDEMKEEGDERKTSGFGRFPAIPRVPGNPTVVWKQKPNVTPYILDRRWPVPTAETVAEAATAAEPAEYKEMENLLGQDLLDAIDCKGSHDC